MLSWLIVGGLAGWLTNTAMALETRHDRLLHLLVGGVGALLGGVPWDRRTHDPDTSAVFTLGSENLALAGARLLLLLVQLRRTRRRPCAAGTGGCQRRIRR